MIATNCASALSSAHKMFEYFVTCSLLLSMTMMVIYFFLLMLYMIIYESEYKQSIGLQGRALGAATFFFILKNFLGFFLVATM